MACQHAHAGRGVQSFSAISNGQRHPGRCGCAWKGMAWWPYDHLYQNARPEHLSRCWRHLFPSQPEGAGGLVRGCSPCERSFPPSSALSLLAAPSLPPRPHLGGGESNNKRGRRGPRPSAQPGRKSGFSDPKPGGRDRCHNAPRCSESDGGGDLRRNVSVAPTPTCTQQRANV